jgi:hypothetical protein
MTQVKENLSIIFPLEKKRESIYFNDTGKIKSIIHFSFGKKREILSISIILDQTKQETSIVCCNLTVKNQIPILESWDLTEGLQNQVKKSNNI